MWLCSASVPIMRHYTLQYCHVPACCMDRAESSALQALRCRRVASSSAPGHIQRASFPCEERVPCRRLAVQKTAVY